MAKTNPSGVPGDLAIALSPFDEVTIAAFSIAELPRSRRADYTQQLKGLLWAVADGIVAQRMVAAITEIERGRERLFLPRNDTPKG